MNQVLTMSVDNFWSWLMGHANCILRAGTPDAVLYDDDDLHWHFAAESDGRWVVQVVRGKRVLGEFFIEPDRVAYVQAVRGDGEDEHVFELMAEAESEQYPAYVFVLVHAFEEDDSSLPRRVH